MREANEIFKDEAAFAQFFNASYKPLCQFAYTYLKDKDSAEDIVQDCFVTLWKNKTAFQVSAKSYLYSAVRNRCLNELKHGKIVDDHQQHVRNTYNFSGDLEAEIEANELFEKINIAIANMPDQRRKIFTLSRYKGLRYSEIAVELGLSPKTVANHMGLAIKYLKEEIKDYLLFPVLIIFLERLGDFLV